MKKLLVLFLGLMFSFAAQAADLSSQALQGSWTITSMAGMADEENDKWEFEGNNFYQNLGGRRISPDPFTVQGDVIDLGYYKIKVLAFDGQHMTADMAGFVYELEKE